MQRVERHIRLNDPTIDHLCFLSKNLYNSANYLVRQGFIKNRKWLRYQDLNKLLKTTKEYRALPAQTAQQILRLLDKNWVSFFRSIKVWKKHPEKYNSMPKLPRYKHKIKGRNIIVFTNQQVKLRGDKIYFPKVTQLKPLTTKTDNILQVRIIPQATCYVIEVVYNKEVRYVELNSDTYLGIDLGIDNLATCTNNIGLKPFVVNGKIPKAINQFYNKKKAKLQSFIGDRAVSNRINRLTFRRNNKVKDYLHKTSRFIIDYCINHAISTIVVGLNKNWKQDVSLGKRNNQNFVSIPFSMLIQQLKYKAEEVGIVVITTEESYTSKCSFLDSEEIRKGAIYQGKRKSRGLFLSSNKTPINADVNGSYNILRKVFPNAFANGIARCGLHPVIVNINGNNYKQSA